MTDLSIRIWAFPNHRSSENSSIEVDKYNLSKPEIIAYQAVLSILSFVGTAGNLFTILALLKSSKLRQKSTTKFVVSLATSDLLYCTITMPMLVWTSSNEFELDDAMCPFYGIVLYAPIAISLITLTSIAINRYVIVCHNAIYETFYSNYKVFLKIALIWFIGFGAHFLPLFEIWGKFGLIETKLRCDIITKDGKSPKIFFALLFSVLPMVIMIFCYTMIFFKIRHMKKELQELNMKGNRDDREVLKMMFTLFICYLVCMIPIAIIQIIDPLKQKIRWHIIPGVIFTGQAITNPFVYAFKNSTYKPAFIKLYQQISFCFPFDTSITTETGETQIKT